MIWRGWQTLLSGALGCLLVACGGGDSGPRVPVLPFSVQQTGPAQVQVDWAFDPYAYYYVVSRNNVSLAQTNSQTLIDLSVLTGFSYCYQVAGIDPAGALSSISAVGCLTVAP